MNKKFYYRGDTFIFPFGLQDESGEYVNFEAGDIVKCGVKSTINDTEYALYKELEVMENTDELVFIFYPEETKELMAGKYTRELEHTRGDYVTTIYQEEITVKGDVVV